MKPDPSADPNAVPGQVPSAVPSAVPNHLRAHVFAGLTPGPRLIVLGAVHGNETCGARAIERTVQDLSLIHI